MYTISNQHVWFWKISQELLCFTITFYVQNLPIVWPVYLLPDQFTYCLTSLPITWPVYLLSDQFTYYLTSLPIVWPVYLLPDQFTPDWSGNSSIYTDWFAIPVL
jgi:hypothetical protein